MDERENPKAIEYEKRRRAKNREYYAAHKDEIRAAINQHRKEHGLTDAARETNRRWRERNREYLAQKTKEWQQKNPEKHRYHNSQQYKRDRQNRIQYARDRRALLNPKVLEARERREFFRGRPWLRNLFGKWKAILLWDQFKGLYEQILNGPCDICGRTGEKMRVDHCHKQKVFRGLLCHGCNVSLGHFADNPVLLQKAIAYLQKAVEVAR